MDDQMLAGKLVLEELEKIIESDELWSAAVFFGNHGVGDWQKQEINVLFRKYVKRNDLVIPVILKSCKREQEIITGFLTNLTHLDFRTIHKKADQIKQLVRSIKGEYMDDPNNY